MNLMSDPIRFWRLCSAAAVCAVLIAAVLAGWWAFAIDAEHGSNRPLPQLPATEALVPKDDSADRPVQLRDTSMFRVDLRPAPAIEDANQADEYDRAEKSPADVEISGQAAARSPATQLMLVGIIEHHDGLRAAIYDPATDRLQILSSGATIGSLSVMTISRRGVRLAGGEATFELELEGAVR